MTVTNDQQGNALSLCLDGTHWPTDAVRATIRNLVQKEKMMNANDYQQLARRTMIDAPDFTISNKQVMIVWNALGLAGEAGEVADLVKKGIFHQHGLDLAKVEKELGDVLWYVAALCSTLGLNLGLVMQANIDKLQARYPEGYSPEASKQRGE
jgi:NTP pyrophosphatase (non-canonical NTP hydrolase)